MEIEPPRCRRARGGERRAGRWLLQRFDERQFQRQLRLPAAAQIQGGFD